MSRPARKDEVLLEDGSVHDCEGAVYCPLALIDAKRYYCRKCGRVFVERDGVFKANGQVIEESDDGNPVSE